MTTTKKATATKPVSINGKKQNQSEIVAAKNKRVATKKVTSKSAPEEALEVTPATKSTKAPKVTPSKKSETVKAPAQPVKVALATTTYHYFRQWVKDILKEGGVTPSFKKEAEGYNGTILVLSTDLVKAKNILDKYTKANPDVVAMWNF